MRILTCLCNIFLMMNNSCYQRGSNLGPRSSVFCLMTKRRKQDYNAIFTQLKLAAQRIGILLNRSRVMIDFEKAVISSLQIFFTNTLIDGCLFHFGQSIYRNLVKFGFKVAYADKSEVRNWFKSLFCLSLIPEECVDEVWVSLLSAQPKLPNIDKFVSSFVKTKDKKIQTHTGAVCS